MGDTSFPVMMSVEEVFNNFKCRRDGVIKALTSEFSSLFFECNPNEKNLCLYGHPNGIWEVNLPSEEVPPVIPEPAVGINFARDEMEIKDLLRLVAVHTDAWLISVAFYFGARYGFDKNERQALFEMINELPTVFEVFEETQQQHQGSGSHAEIEEERNKEGSTLCGACGDPYKLDEFWIFCNYCKTWYHGKCVKITPSMAERIGQYMCHTCAALQLYRFH